MQSPFEEFVKNANAMRILGKQIDDDFLISNTSLPIFEHYVSLKNYASKPSVIACVSVKNLIDLHDVIVGYGRICKFSFGMGVGEFKRLRKELKESDENNAKSVVKQLNQHHDEAVWRHRRSLMYQKSETWDSLCKLVENIPAKKRELEKIKQNWEVHAPLAHCTSYDLVFMAKSLQSIEVYVESSLPLLEAALKKKRCKIQEQQFYQDYCTYLKQLKVLIQKEKERLIFAMMARLTLSSNQSDVSDDDLIWHLEYQLTDLGLFNEGYLKEVKQQSIRKTLSEEALNYFCHYLSQEDDQTIKQLTFLTWQLPEEDQFKIRWIKLDTQWTLLPEALNAAVTGHIFNQEEIHCLTNTYAFVKLQIVFNENFNKIQQDFEKHCGEFDDLKTINSVMICLEVLSQECARIQKVIHKSSQIKQALESWYQRLVYRQQILLQQALHVIKKVVDNHLKKLSQDWNDESLKKMTSHFNTRFIQEIVARLDQFQSALPQDEISLQYKSDKNELLSAMYDCCISLQSQLVRGFLMYLLQSKSKKLCAHRLENDESIYLPEPDQLLSVAAEVRSFLTPPNQESLDDLVAFCMGKKLFSVSEFDRTLTVLAMTCQWGVKEQQSVKNAVIEHYLMRQLHSPFSLIFLFLKEVKGVAWANTWEAQFYKTIQTVLNNIKRAFEQGLYEHSQESYRDLTLTLPSVKEKEIQLFHEGILKLKALRHQSPGHWNLLLSSVDHYIKRYDGKTTLFHPLIEALGDEERLYQYTKKRFSTLLNSDQTQLKRDSLLLQHSKNHSRLRTFIQEELCTRLIPSFDLAKYPLDQKIRFLIDKDLFVTMVLLADTKTLPLFYQMSDKLFLDYIKRLIASPPCEETINKAKQWLSQICDKRRERKVSFPSPLGKEHLTDFLIRQTQFDWNPITHLMIDAFGDRETYEIYALKWFETVLFDPNQVSLIKDEAEKFGEVAWGHLSGEGQRHFCKLVHQYLDQAQAQLFSNHNTALFEWLGQKITRLTFDHDGLLIREKVKDRYEEISNLLAEFKKGQRDAKYFIEKIQSRRFEAALHLLGRIKDDWWVATQSLDTTWRERSLQTIHARIQPLIDLTAAHRLSKEQQQRMDEFLKFYDSKNQPHTVINSLDQKFKTVHQVWQHHARSTQSWMACRLLDQMKVRQSLIQYPHYLENGSSKTIAMTSGMDMSFQLPQNDQQKLQEIGDLYHAYTQRSITETCLDWRIDSSMISDEKVRDELKTIQKMKHPVAILLFERLVQDLKNQSAGGALLNRWNLFLLLHLRQIFCGTSDEMNAKIEQWLNYVKALLETEIFSFDDLDLQKQQTKLLEDILILFDHAKKSNIQQKPVIQELQNLIAQAKKGLDDFIHQLSQLESVKAPLLMDLELMGDVDSAMQITHIEKLMQSPMLDSVLNLSSVQCLFNLRVTESSQASLVSKNYEKKYLMDAIDVYAQMINELTQLQNQLSSKQRQFTKTCKQLVARILNELGKTLSVLIIEMKRGMDACDELQSVQTTIVQFKEFCLINNDFSLQHEEKSQTSSFSCRFFSQKELQGMNGYSEHQIKSVIKTIVKMTFENLSSHQRKEYEQSDVSIVTDALYRYCHRYLSAFCDAVFFHQHIDAFVNKFSCVAHSFVEEKSLSSKALYMLTNYNPYALLTSRKYIFVEPQLKDRLESEDISTPHNHVVFLKQRIGEIGLGVCKKFKALMDYQDSHESSMNFTEMKRIL